MYLEFYGLRKEAFHITPDPDMFYLSPSHKEALAAVVYGVDKGLGFVMYTGEVGTGKTTVLRAYLEQIRRTRIRPIYLFNPDLTFESLLRQLLHELGIDARGRSERWMLHYLMRALVQELGKNRRVVLIIDEAQHMPAHTLEKLRLFSNIETMDEKLLQIVLVGQPELDIKLNAYSMRQLKQRIAVRATIRPLTREESIDYIRHRIARAGSDVDRIMTRWAVRSIVRAARGYPRSINILCDNVLVSGFGAQQRPVGARIARTIIADLRGRSRRGWFSWVPRLAAGLAIGAAALAGGQATAAAEDGSHHNLRAENAG